MDHFPIDGQVAIIVIEDGILTQGRFKWIQKFLKIDEGNGNGNSTGTVQCSTVPNCKKSYGTYGTVRYRTGTDVRRTKLPFHSRDKKKYQKYGTVATYNFV